MHILIVCSERLTSWDSPIGGIFQMDQAQGLAKQGNKVSIIAAAPITLNSLLKRSFNKKAIPDPSDLAVVLRSSKKLFFPARFFKNVYKRSFLKEGLKLWNKYVTKYGEPDVLHVHNAFYAGLLAVEIKDRYKYKGKIILTEHDSGIISLKATKSKIKEYLKVYNSANKVIAVSSYLKQQLVAKFNLSNNLIKVVPNVLDNSFVNVVLKKWEHNTNEISFINVGRLVGVKDHQILIKAFNKAIERNSKLKLKIVGEGPLLEKLKALPEYKQNKEKIHFLGFLSREELIHELMKSDFFILSSRHETFGVALIEAQALGLPTIAFAGSGPDDIINETNGVLVQNRAIEDLSNAIMKISEMPTQFDRSEIRRQCINRFSEIEISKHLLLIYKGCE